MVIVKLSRERGTFPSLPPYSYPEAVMRFNLSPKARMLLAIPLLILAYPAVTMIIPAMLRCMVPNVVRSVLSLM